MVRVSEALAMCPSVGGVAASWTLYVVVCWAQRKCLYLHCDADPRKEQIRYWQTLIASGKPRRFLKQPVRGRRSSSIHDDSGNRSTVAVRLEHLHSDLVAKY